MISFSVTPEGEQVTYVVGLTTYTPSNTKRTAINQTATFTAATSFPTGVSPVEYRWDFGDGIVAYGNPVNHVYKTIFPECQAVLRVTDSNGETHYSRKQIYLARLSPYETAVKAESSLQSYWRLAETSGVMVDEKGAAPGTVVGGTRGVDGLVTDDPNKAYEDNGNADHIDCGDHYGFGGTAQFTVELILETTTGPLGNATWVSKLEYAQNGWQVGSAGGGSLWVDRWQAHAVTELVGGASVPGERVHWAYTYDGTNDRIYKNGILRAGPTAGRAINAAGSAYSLIIAAAAPYTGPGAIIDEVAIYNTALPATTLLAHAQLAILPTLDTFSYDTLVSYGAEIRPKSDWSIASGALATSMGFNGILYRLDWPTLIDARVKCNRDYAPWNSGVVLRKSDGTGLSFGQPVGGSWVLNRFDSGGTFTTLDTQSGIGSGPNADDTYQLELQKVGNVVKRRAYNNSGVLLQEKTYTLTGTDATDLGAGVPVVGGVYANHSSSPGQFDWLEFGNPV